VVDTVAASTSSITVLDPGDADSNTVVTRAAIGDRAHDTNDMSSTHYRRWL
jgi:hypothetical protein